MKVIRLAGFIGLAVFRNATRSALRTGLTAFGVLIGAMLLVLLLGFTTGLEHVARDELLGQLNLRTIRVFGLGNANLVDKDVAALSSLPGVESVFHEIRGPAIFELQGGLIPFTLLGLDRPIDQPTFGTTLADAGGTPNAAVIPSTLAKFLTESHVPADAVGVRFKIRPQHIGLSGATPTLVNDDPVELLVVGVRIVDDPTVQVPDASDLYLNLPLARSLETPNALGDRPYSTVLVVANDATDAVRLTNDLIAKGYAAVSLKKNIDEVEKTFAAIRVVLAVFAGIALFVGSIGIANTMFVTVLERTREIGVLQSLGAARGVIRALVLGEAAFIGLVGGGMGLLVALVAGRVGAPFVREQMGSGGARLPAGDLFIVPLDLGLGVLALIAVVSIAAAVLPGERAARMEPAVALRHE